MKISRKILKSLCLSANFVLFFSCTANAKPFESDASFYQNVINSFNSPESNHISNKEKLQSINVSNLPSEFPDEVYVKTLTQTFLKGFQFILKDGKIYSKQDGETEWKIFLKSGKPKDAEEICEIYADGDCLFAFDNKGRLFKIYTQKFATEKPFVWKNTNGWPQKTQLVQNDLVIKNRGWAMGARRKDVLWYEDIFKNQHHYGTMGLETIYFLSEDGQRILFTDSGLPNDFSKSIENPEDGKFIARNIANSASTLFLIGDDGTMYTRLIDFDTMGCDPMFFKYTYVKLEQKYAGSEYLSNYSPWGLPAEPWKKENPIKLEGKAHLTKFISIHQNGVGNYARELRVAGTDSEGNTGYYYKQILNDDWNFKKAPLKFAENDFLTGNKSRGNTTDFSYSGYLSLNGKKNEGIEISTQNFSLTSEGGFDLNFKMKGSNWSEEKILRFYNVMQWTYVTRVAPGYDGTAMYYFVTPVFDDSLLKCEHEEFEKILKSIFEKNNKKTFALTAAATTDYLEIYGNENTITKTPFKIFLTKTQNSQIAQYNSFLSPETMKVLSNYFLYNEDNPESSQELLLEKGKIYTQENLQEIQGKIQDNIFYRRFLNGELEAYKKYSRNSNISRWSYNFVDLIATVTLLNQIDFPKIKTMSSFGGRLLKSNAESFQSFYEYRSLTAPHVISLLDLRIKAYKKLENEIEQNGNAVLPNQLRNSYAEYFDEAKIPDFVEGISPRKFKAEKASFSRINSLAMYPGFYLTIGDSSNEQTVLVVAQKSAKTIFDRGKKNNSYENLKKKPLKLKVNFIVEEGKSRLLDSATRVSFLDEKEGTLTWNGESIKIIVDNKSIFEGSIN